MKRFEISKQMTNAKHTLYIHHKFGWNWFFCFNISLPSCLSKHKLFSWVDQFVVLFVEWGLCPKWRQYLYQPGDLEEKITQRVPISGDERCLHWPSACPTSMRIRVQISSTHMKYLALQCEPAISPCGKENAWPWNVSWLPRILHIQIYICVYIHIIYMM